MTSRPSPGLREGPLVRVQVGGCVEEVVQERAVSLLHECHHPAAAAVTVPLSSLKQHGTVSGLESSVGKGV